MKLNRIIGMFLLGMPLAIQAQEKVVPIKYGDMDQWVTRKIHESGIIGGIQNCCMSRAYKGDRRKCGLCESGRISMGKF